jgi:hypothetical protein
MAMGYMRGKVLAAAVRLGLADALTKPSTVAAIDGARERLAGTTVSEPLELVAGDLFERVTVQADAVVMRNVLHVDDDSLAEVLLRNCRAIMGGDDRLIMSDLNMMVVTGGRERTIDDWRRLLGSSGLELDTIRSVRGDGHYTALTARL